MPFFTRHVLDDLAAFDDGQLDAAGMARVRAHLARCPACIAALEDVRRARQLLQALPAVSMPDEDAARLAARLLRQRTSTPPRRSMRRPLVAAAAALAIIAAGAAIARYAVGIRPELDRTAHPPGLERLAGELHAGLRDRGTALDYASSDSAQVRAWLAARAAPPAPLVSDGPAGHGWPAIVVRGASVVEAGGAPASLVAYDVNGFAATLLTAREADVPDAPAGAWLAKRVYFSRDAGGRPVLTWTSSGQTYAIVSDLPGVGEQACYVCHVSADFKRALDEEVQRLGGTERVR